MENKREVKLLDDESLDSEVDETSTMISNNSNKSVKDYINENNESVRIQVNNPINREKNTNIDNSLKNSCVQLYD